MRFQILIFLFLEWSSVILGKNARIIGGASTYISEYPFVVSIRNMHSNHFYCAGSIISDRHIVTSGHCLLPFSTNFSNLRVYTGVTNIKKTDGPNFEIEKIFFNPEFRNALTMLLYHRYDIAVLKLTRSIPFNQNQKPIELADRNIFSGNYAVIVGWGLTTYPRGIPAERLQRAPMMLFEPNECAPQLPTVIHSDQFCAYYTRGLGTCIGDSGGPVIKDQKLVGVISLSYGCGMGFPDIHSNVFILKSFILESMRY